MTNEDEPTSIGLANHLTETTEQWQLTTEEKIAALHIALNAAVEDLELSIEIDEEDQQDEMGNERPENP